MTIDDFREKYPEYNDLSDEDILALSEDDSEDILPVLQEIKVAIEAMKIPASFDYKQIENKLNDVYLAVKSVEIAINKLKLSPAINVPAPVVKVEQAPSGSSPSEWTFDVKRDKSGFIESVVARS